MKPISLRFQCFGPYMKEQFIDFTKLQENGLFLICGQTGAGKTTILDGICYALYGQSSGGNRGELSQMRCKLAGKNDETRVEYVFETGMGRNRKRYQFVRSLKWKTKNISESHNCMVYEDGNYVPIFENPKKSRVNEKAEELIGLTCEQFRQVVILPQGQFEKFLVSNSKEKEEILVHLFQVDNYQRIVDEVSNRVNAEDAALKNEKNDIYRRMSEHGCESLKEIKELCEKKSQALLLLGEKLAQAAKDKEEKKNLHDRMLVEEKEFIELEHCQQIWEQLEEQTASMEAEKKRLDRAKRSDIITREYDTYDRTKSEAKQQEQKREEERKCFDRAKMECQEAKEAWKEHEEQQKNYEQDKKISIVYENAVQIYEQIAYAEDVLESSKKELVEAEKKWNESCEQFAKRQREENIAMSGQAEAMEAYTMAQRQYLQGISAQLALEQLREGKPCPVCGSTTHPHPAEVSENHVSKEELNKLEQASGKAQQNYQSARQLCEQARSTQEQLAGSYHQAQAKVMAHSKVLEGLEAQKLSGIENQKALLSCKKKCADRIRQYEQQQTILGERLEAAQMNFTKHQALLEQAVAQEEQAIQHVQKAEKNWDKAYRQQGFADTKDYLDACMKKEDMETATRNLIAYDTKKMQAKQEYESKRERLKDKVRPQLDKVKAALEQAEEYYRELDQSLAVDTQEQKRLEEEYKSLKKRLQKHDERREKVDENLEFAKRLSGRTGVSLQRYVLGVMLSSITAQANCLLKNVHHGRYQIYKSNQRLAGTQKGGLDLEVYDNTTNERRSVITLSGGEKFLVSLSLAIGLSSVVQAQGGGVSLEAMFVDEGFGSLDYNSIMDALEVLHSVQKSNGLVGIISHVELLEDTIPTKIVIHKGKDGSECEVVG